MYSKVLIIPTFCGAALGAVYNVEVGNGGLNFKPETVSAKAGDTVVFQLFPGHNAVQGDFASPCTPSGQGFYSGPYSDTNSGQLKFVVNVTSSDPVYYYCSVSSHCQLGMVGGINLPSSGNTISAYRSAANNVAGQSVTPTERRGGELSANPPNNSTTAASSSAASQSSAATRSSSAASSSAASGSAAASSASAATRSGTSSVSAAASSAPAATPSRAGAVGTVTPVQAKANGLVAMVVGFAAWIL